MLSLKTDDILTLSNRDLSYLVAREVGHIKEEGAPKRFHASSSGYWPTYVSSLEDAGRLIGDIEPAVTIGEDAVRLLTNTSTIVTRPKNMDVIQVIHGEDNNWKRTICEAYIKYRAKRDV